MASYVRYSELKVNSSRYWLMLGVLAVLIAAGMAAAHYMETEGHHVSGMNNQIVWGLPHVFAIFLIVAASGALTWAGFRRYYRSPYLPGD